MRQRDSAALFRYDQGDSVAIFGDADRRAMPQAQLTIREKSRSQRHHARRRRDAMVLDDDGAIMEDCMMVEDRGEQLCGHQCVYEHTGFDVFLQAGAALE
ncbi:hypothetical protein RZS08_03445, partial [Arthrospira platensis SPKY1]|nr:hypothetical protein [Arthrospira platensis SPKY1]